MLAILKCFSLSFKYCITCFIKLILFQVREAETSNSLVLVPGLQLPESIKSERNENRKLSNKIVS